MSVLTISGSTPKVGGRLRGSAKEPQKILLYSSTRPSQKKFQARRKHWHRRTVNGRGLQRLLTTHPQRLFASSGSVSWIPCNRFSPGGKCSLSKVCTRRRRPQDYGELTSINTVLSCKSYRGTEVFCHMNRIEAGITTVSRRSCSCTCYSA